MAATPQEIKKYMKKGAETVEEGLPGWFGTFADMMTLLFAFFVLLLHFLGTFIPLVTLLDMPNHITAPRGTC